MPWKVQSSIVGGRSLSVAKSQAYSSEARKLCSLANEFSSLGASWQHAAMIIAQQTSVFQRSANKTVWQYESSPFAKQASRCALTSNMCTHYARKCQHLSQRLQELASLIVRANSLYGDAELRAKENFDNQIALLTSVMPFTSIPFFAGAALAALDDAKQHTGFEHVAQWSHATQSVQQGTIRGLAQHMMLNPVTGLPIFALGVIQSSRNHHSSTKGRFNNVHTNFLRSMTHHFQSPVPFVSSAFSLISAPINNHMQGNTLRLHRISQPWRKPAFVLPRKGRNLRETLDNLTELGSGHLGVRPPLANPDAATIAIQRFKRADGRTSWLVIIPGTDGKAHSPFGWEQNAEVMSHSPLTRKQADSTRMVLEAMKRSGIQRKDPVALVGHSQGGIVAASIASDYAKQYNIQHVVTAGSPIANHPIPQHTWVTSIEMEDELVPSLDGKENPRRNNWVTIHGRASHVRKTQRPLPPGVTRFSGSMYSRRKFDNTGILVNDVPEEGTLTHDLHYHTAAYEDALQLGSQSVRRQDQHFQKIIDGELQSTTLWQGVMQ